ncbi:chloroplast outer envelope protein 86 [Spatholobus suberectus]|nr:chloroplast outer envelope protein 86 [Spatholobus suberectus]
MALPLSFANLEPTSQLQTKPVLDMHGWDRDCGYSGVKLEHSVAIANQFPATIAVEITKDKKDFSILLDSSVAAKHGENISSMVGLDIQEIGPKLAYILRGETKFKNFKGNKTGLGVCMTCWGENLATGFKLVDQMVLGKHMVLGGSAGIVGYEDGFAYGTNVEVWFREADFPIGQNQSSLGLSLVKRAKDWPLEAIANFQSQFSIGRNYKIAVCASLSNALYGDITVKASSSDQLQIALLAILLFARAVFKKFWPSP